ATNIDQRQILEAALLPPLEKRKAQLVKKIARTEVTRVSFKPTGMDGPPVFTGFARTEIPLSQGETKELATLRTELDQIDTILAQAKKGDRDILARLYQEKTGIDLRFVGFNPALKDYRNGLEAKGNEYTEMAKLLGAMAKG
ncbi:MAG: hypothetical protein Q7S00_03835, partial [bacterium]|nr:hypothetical protein [bacterium]